MRRLHHTRNFAAVFVALLFLSFCVPLSAWAHCDSLEGPVVKDARVALEKGDVTPVLKWVTKDHELEIRDVFRQTMAVRAKGEEAKALADMYFFETLVRIHRAGEGEAFTGLKPAGSVEPGIEAADEALRSGSAKELATHLSAEVADGIQRRFSLARERGAHAADSVDAGRQYVDAYVDYIHYVETFHRLVAQGVFPLAPRTDSRGPVGSHRRRTSASGGRVQSHAPLKRGVRPWTVTGAPITINVQVSEATVSVW